MGGWRWLGSLGVEDGAFDADERDFGVKKGFRSCDISCYMVIVLLRSYFVPPFVTSFLAVAYADIVPVLSSIAATIGKSHSDIVIFDPFYCEGSVCSNLAALGFPNVINKKQVEIVVSFLNRAFGSL